MRLLTKTSEVIEAHNAVRKSLNNTVEWYPSHYYLRVVGVVVARILPNNKYSSTSYV